MPDIRLSVKSIRTNMKKSQGEMAKALNIATATYCNKENGSFDWTWEEIKKISEMSNIPENMIE